VGVEVRAGAAGATEKARRRTTGSVLWRSFEGLGGGTGGVNSSVRLFVRLVSRGIVWCFYLSFFVRRFRISMVPAVVWAGSNTFIYIYEYLTISQLLTGQVSSFTIDNSTTTTSFVSLYSQPMHMHVLTAQSFSISSFLQALFLCFLGELGQRVEVRERGRQGYKQCILSLKESELQAIPTKSSINGILRILSTAPKTRIPSGPERIQPCQRHLGRLE